VRVIVRVHDLNSDYERDCNMMTTVGDHLTGLLYVLGIEHNP
jgi:hypothetical protein